MVEHATAKSMANANYSGLVRQMPGMFDRINMMNRMEQILQILPILSETVCGHAKASLLAFELIPAPTVAVTEM